MEKIELLFLTPSLRIKIVSIEKTKNPVRNAGTIIEAELFYTAFYGWEFIGRV